MKIKKLLSLLLSAALLMTPLAACGSGAPSASGSGTESGVGSSAAPDLSQDTEEVDTGDASLDDPRNQDQIGEKELLVVSFGTSYNDSRRLTIGAIETALAEAFPDWSVRRAFTSQIIIDRVRERDGVEIDNVKAALDRAVDNGVKTLVVQPTHLMDGLEYTDLVDELAQYTDAFEHIAVGAPLLTSDGDFQAVADAITQATAQYDDGDTAICFMGHGTEAESNRIYGEMQQVLEAAGHDLYYVGTVEAEPTLEDVLAGVKDSGAHRVVLQPLMIVAGDHANNDMAGSDEDSWLSQFNASGAFESVDCQIAGLGEVPSIQELYVAHTKSALDSLNG